MCLECDMKKDGKSLSVLHLVVKGKWFEMIAAGVKKEDYREFKFYWDRRLLRWKEALADKEALMVGKLLFPYKNFIDDYYRHYDRVHISLGYSKEPSRNMVFECDGIHCGLNGKKEWGAPVDGRPYYIIKLGKRIS